MVLPLQDIRIVDFSEVVAGPYGTMLLTFLGAEVIRVESAYRPDFIRNRDTGQWNDFNVNKLGATLNLKDPRAVELVKRLVKLSHVVVQTFRPGVAERLGLGYEPLKEIKPDIIFVAESGFGATGPERHYRAYAAQFAALGGLAGVTGHSDGTPTEQRASVDARVGQIVSFAVLAALYHWRKTGEGQYIDISSRELITSHLGEVMMDYVMNRRNQTPQGNRDHFMAPHNCYPCRGQGKWVSIAVSTDEEWRALCDVMGNPPWTKEERFADMMSRWQNQEDLDRLIGQWTSKYTHYEVTELLQKAGVAAMPSFNSEEIMNDPHLKERDFIIGWQEHPKVGRRFVYCPPWKLSDVPAKVYRSAPLLGQHNKYVFGELLGLSDKEISDLQAEKVIY